MLLVEAWQFILAHPERFLGALGTHIALSASALGIAIAIAVPIGVLLSGTQRAAQLRFPAPTSGARCLRSPCSRS
jgi:ABC-type proline/glycine betaine transport system permease subunit